MRLIRRRSQDEALVQMAARLLEVEHQRAQAVGNLAKAEQEIRNLRDWLNQAAAAADARDVENANLAAEIVRLRQIVPPEPVEAPPITLPAGSRPCSRCGQPMPFGTAHYCPDMRPERRAAA